MKTVLTIAGSDSSGGAGVQADIKTMTMNGVYAMSAVTALTAQNKERVYSVQHTDPDFLGQQLDAVFAATAPDAVKIGMLGTPELVSVVVRKLQQYDAGNLVVDPVMVAACGATLMSEEALDAFQEELLQLADVVTPNLAEAEILTDMEIETEEDMVTSARRLSSMYGCAVLLQSGGARLDAGDLLYADGEPVWFPGVRVGLPDTHGVGCTLSSAVAANLAKGYGLEDSVARAEEYLTLALSAGKALAEGLGAMNHAFQLVGKFGIEKP